MTAMPSRFHLPFAAALAALMIATRFHHFGTALHLPDASMALFFLGGLWLRRHLAFLAFMALAVGLDWVAVSYAGVSDFCVTPAYAFLLPAYAVLWYAGRMWSARMSATPGALACAFAIALAAASVSFAMSNGSFYWLGGRYAHPNLGEYLARLWQWGPLFVRTTLAYVAIALACYAVLARAVRMRGEGAQA